MLCLWHWVDHVYHINPFTSAKKMIKPPKNPGGKSWICPCWGKMRLWHGQITLDYMGFSFIPSFGEFMPSCKLIQPLLANYLPIQNGATFHTPGPPLRWPWCPHASSSSAPRGPAPDPVFPYEKMNWFMKSSCARQNRQKNKKNIIV